LGLTGFFQVTDHREGVEVPAGIFLHHSHHFPAKSLGWELPFYSLVKTTFHGLTEICMGWGKQFSVIQLLGRNDANTNPGLKFLGNSGIVSQKGRGVGHLSKCLCCWSSYKCSLSFVPARL
jgi:hypothetical protein